MVVESLGFAEVPVLLGEVVVLPGIALVSLPTEPRGAVVVSEPVLGAAGVAMSPEDPAGGEPMLPEPVVVVVESVLVVVDPERSPVFAPLPVEVESDGVALESEGSLADEPVEGAPRASVSLAAGVASGALREWRLDAPVRAWPWRCSVFGFIDVLSLSLAASSGMACADFLLSSEAPA